MITIIIWKINPFTVQYVDRTNSELGACRFPSVALQYRAPFAADRQIRKEQSFPHNLM
jgi:hypothetical protein